MEVVEFGEFSGRGWGMGDGEGERGEKWRQWSMARSLFAMRIRGLGGDYRLIGLCATDWTLGTEIQRLAGEAEEGFDDAEIGWRGEECGGGGKCLDRSRGLGLVERCT